MPALLEKLKYLVTKSLGSLESRFLNTNGLRSIYHISNHLSRFEVELEDGQVLHSKINGGGYVDTPAKMESIVSGIEQALLKI